MLTNTLVKALTKPQNHDRSSSSTRFRFFLSRSSVSLRRLSVSCRRGRGGEREEREGRGREGRGGEGGEEREGSREGWREGRRGRGGEGGEQRGMDRGRGREGGEREDKEGME